MESEGMVVFISGPPGSGKTTLARHLSAECERGVHLVSDEFYGFVQRLTDPSLPESHRQNTVVLEAVARAAEAFAAGGYTVYLDGVMGPWFLPTFKAVLSAVMPVHYVVLRVSEKVAAERVSDREGKPAPSAVSRMVPKFAELGDLDGHTVETTGRSTSEVHQAVKAGLAEGVFQIDWERVSG